jgi:long-subunit fatty acid transport protein
MALVNCKQCGNGNAKEAKTCPKCGASLRMGMGKKILLGFGALFVIGAVRAAMANDSRAAHVSAAAMTTPASQAMAQETPQAETVGQATGVQIGTLLSEYKSNEVRADDTFKGQWISTSGIVGDVKKDILGDVYVTVGTGRPFEIPKVQCFVARDQIANAASYSKGDKVTVTGRVDGLMMNVLVKECRFE